MGRKTKRTANSNKANKTRYFLFFAAAAIVFLFDQLIKALVDKSVTGKIPVINDFFYISNIQNFGASFGMLQNKTFLLIAVSIIIMAGIIIFLKKSQKAEKILVIFTAMLFGGALGNLADRIIRGFVIDYIEFVFWPAFNIADIAITLGAVGTAYYILKKY